MHDMTMEIELAKQNGIQYRLTPDGTTEMWCHDSDVQAFAEAVRAAACAELRRLEAANAELLTVLGDILYALEKARIWGGMDWTYNPLHPVHYLPARDKARAAIAAQHVPQYDQQALELCEVCGWKTLIPGEGCLNCERKPLTLDCYDAGLLNDFGGGNVEWWQDYIRAELARAHEFYQSQIKE